MSNREVGNDHSGRRSRLASRIAQAAHALSMFGRGNFFCGIRVAGRYGPDRLIGNYYRASINIPEPCFQLPADYAVAFCPMYKGGSKWVQKKETLANPYYGKTMQTCGSFVN